MKPTKQERAERLEAKARRARAEALAITDEKVKKALRIHDLADDLSSQFDESDPSCAVADRISDDALGLLALLGAPL